MSADVTLELRRPYLALAAATLFFGAPTVLFACRAATNERGLILNGILPLAPAAATFFYAALALLGLGMMGMGALAMVKLARRSTYRLVVTDTGVTVPDARAWRAQQDATIAWRDLIGVSVTPEGDPRRGRQLVLRSRSGVHGVHRRVLPPDWPIERLVQFLTVRWRQS